MLAIRGGSLAMNHGLLPAFTLSFALLSSATVLAQPPKETPKDLDKLWEQLASDDAAEAFRAMAALAKSPKEAVAFLKDHLKPIPPPDPKVIDKLITNLNSPQYNTRQKATAELE